ncbi:MAG: GIY-YIG nuclease family protein [Phycisphaerales bacterium]|jgi:putative endonuclease|nr:GIY-YIG nuclease family protein [Phycisphaerales bacterium]
MTASAQADSFFVYILKCADGSFYVGQTTNIEERVKLHNEGRAAIWTACRRPVQIAYSERYDSIAEAVLREHQIKRWTHQKKLALVQGDMKTLKSLAKRRVY